MSSVFPIEVGQRGRRSGRSARACAEPAIADRELRRQSVGEGEVLLIPVAHRHRAARRITKPLLAPLRTAGGCGHSWLGDRSTGRCSACGTRAAASRSIADWCGRVASAAIVSRHREAPGTGRARASRRVVVRVVSIISTTTFSISGSMSCRPRSRIRPGSRHPHVGAPSTRSASRSEAERCSTRASRPTEGSTPPVNCRSRRGRQGSRTVGEERTTSAPGRPN